MHRENIQDLKPQEFTFDALNLQVGVRLQFITQRDVRQVFHFSTLIGYARDEYIIVRIPAGNGVPIGLTEGERITIRVFSGVNICSFACTVERVFARPLNYVHLSFPTSIQGTSLRSAMRVKVALPAHVRSTARPDLEPIGCRMTNLSVTGARIELARPLPQGEELVNLEFMLALPNAGRMTEVDTLAMVRNLAAERQAPGEPEIFSYGLQFVGLDPVHHTLVQNMVYEALLADRMKIV
jgi:c-di-GMP-binding flagellar brake protein YcgR